MSENKNPIISAVGLSKVFRDFWSRPKAKAVNDIDFEVYEGEVIGLLGPNGSGKSTLKSVINPALLGVYINPDDIEREIKEFGFLNLAAYRVSTNEKEVLTFFKNSTLLALADLLDDVENLRFTDNKLVFLGVNINSYFASVASDFIRQKLLETATSFTFETVGRVVSVYIVDTGRVVGDAGRIPKTLLGLCFAASHRCKSLALAHIKRWKH